MIIRARIRQTRFLAGASILAIVVLITACASWVSDYDPDAQIDPQTTRLQSPSPAHLLGTDQFGRDVFTRILHGGRISLFIALSVMALAVIVGTLCGTVAGYLGGGLDSVLMRIVNLFLAFPLIFIVATCIALFGQSLFWLILILALTGWMDIARLVRAEVQALKNSAFILRARATGLPTWRIFLRYLIPGVAATITAVAVLRAADIILIESALSFLGLGVQPPTASWGAILKDGRAFLASAWWISLFPAIAIILTTLGLYLIGEGLKSEKS
ncbi:MAG: ABC transporter permease [bacterium]